MAKGKYAEKREHAQTEKKETTTWAMDEDLLEHKEGAARLVDLDFEEQAARNAAGMEEQVYGIWGVIWKINQFFDKYKKPHTVKKKTYLLLILFTGWFGGHRWYEKRYVLAVLYTAFCWTGVPLAMAILDAFQTFPLKADENGMITYGNR